MIKHTIYSKYSDARQVLVVSDSIITIKASDQQVVCTGFGNSSSNSYQSIEFTGGPNLSVNGSIRVAGRTFRIASMRENEDSYSGCRSFTLNGRFA